MIFIWLFALIVRNSPELGTNYLLPGPFSVKFLLMSPKTNYPLVCTAPPHVVLPHIPLMYWVTTPCCSSDCQYNVPYLTVTSLDSRGRKRDKLRRALIVQELVVEMISSRVPPGNTPTPTSLQPQDPPGTTDSARLKMLPTPGSIYVTSAGATACQDMTSYGMFQIGTMMWQD